MADAPNRTLMIVLYVVILAMALSGFVLIFTQGVHGTGFVRWPSPAAMALIVGAGVLSLVVKIVRRS